MNITIREGVASVWHYHLAINDIPICGNKETMSTDLPLDTWGYKSDHIPESYCKECNRIAKEKHLVLT